MHLQDRLVEQLRSERELRVLLQEKQRVPFFTRLTNDPSSTMELTCHGKVQRSHSLSSILGGNSATSGDSGNESLGSRKKSTRDDDVVVHLQEVKQQLHENLVHNMRLLDQKDFMIEEYEARIRELEQRSDDLQSQLQSAQLLLKQAEASRAQSEQRLQVSDRIREKPSIKLLQ